MPRDDDRIEALRQDKGFKGFVRALRGQTDEQQNRFFDHFGTGEPGTEGAETDEQG